MNVVIDSQDFHSEVQTKRVLILTDSVGCTCVGKDDLYDLGFRDKDVKRGAILTIGDVEIELRPRNLTQET